MIFQQFHLVPHLNALENVMLAQYFHSIVDRDQAEGLMSRIGLKERLHHYPSELSGGEQQRVCIARALINEPKILLADEPTGNLDEQNEKEIIRLLIKLHEEEGLTIVMVTHDLAVGRMADRQIELNHGRLIAATPLVKQIEDDIDDAMEQLWLLHEEGQLDMDHIQKNSLILKEEVLSHLRAIRLLQVENGSITFTTAGEQRARDIIRRHRLGECLFAQTFGLSTREASDEACQLEHIISQDVAEKICTFLGHPTKCPHGHPIPSGNCCRQIRLAGIG
jgi:ABC-type methionine transport system ATPase subunit